MNGPTSRKRPAPGIAPDQSGGQAKTPSVRSPIGRRGGRGNMVAAIRQAIERGDEDAAFALTVALVRIMRAVEVARALRRILR